MQKNTNGILNYINELYFCSSIKNSIAIQNLIRYHKPKQERELVALIESHGASGSMCSCPCGSKAKGKIEDFANNLYQSYLDFKNKSKDVPNKSFDDCFIFMRNLFITNSLRGDSMEIKAKNHLVSKISKEFTIEQSSQLEDFKFAIDLILKSKDGREIVGFQIKPISYLNYDQTHPIVITNINKNNMWHSKVFYLYYNKNLDFTNIDSVLNDVDIYIKNIYHGKVGANN